MQWSKNKENKFKKLYPTMTDEEVAKIMRLSLGFVRRKAEELELEKEPVGTVPFTTEEISFVKALYPTKSPKEIGLKLGRSATEVEYLAQSLGVRKPKGWYDRIAERDQNLDIVKQWEKEYNQKEMGCSKGHYLVGKILKEIYPFLEHKDEVPIGKLRLDWYVPQLGIAIEFHGVQHEQHIKFFHKTESDFKDAINRDHEKIDMCNNLGITIIRFYHDEPITIDVLKAKIREVI
jgi:very-short-patch-repair endonuclease